MAKGFVIKIKREKLEKIITVLTFILVYGFIFYLLDFRLIFTNTTITGGDTGSQVYIPYYLKQIFPLVRWWSPDWYSGFPFLYYYPPLVYLLTVILSFIIPINISFKIIIALCFLIYPLTFYLIFRLLGFKFPMPQIASVFSLFLIFLEKYSIYGGNLPSLLSGQFSHTLSIALLFLFFALCFKGIKENKYQKLNMLLGAAVVLSHPISGMLLIICSLFLLFSDTSKDLNYRFYYIFKVLLGIFLLSAFWTIPLVFYQKYAGIMNWARQINMDYLFPEHWQFLSISAVLGIIMVFIKKERRFIPFISIFILCGFLYFYLDNSSIWNTRFLPYLNFGILLMAAYFLGFILNKIWGKVWLLSLILFFALVLISFYQVRANTSYSPFWFKWNFEGYQAKPQWNKLNDFFSELSKLPKGRVLWEYNADYNQYGTPRALETLPIFAKQPTYEGLLIESSLFGAFHFINQTETSETPTSAVAGFVYPPFDFKKGIEHMKLSGVSYYVAYTEKLKMEADANPDSLTKIKETSAGFNIYKLKDSTLVDPVSNFSVSMQDKNWLMKSIEWYKGNTLNNPIVFAKNNQEKAELNKFLSSNFKKGNKVQDVKWGRDFVEFKTNSINTPYIIKVSYFPTWRVIGAKGPYLISPSYMMVIPTGENVKLYFSYGVFDWMGILLTLGGIIYLFYGVNLSSIFKLQIPKPTLAKKLFPK